MSSSLRPKPKPGRHGQGGEHAPDRVVWGTDWPHPASMVGEKVQPDDAQLLDLFGEWATDQILRHTVLVDNPCQLYGFVYPGD